jgi:hypothetical protein
MRNQFGGELYKTKKNIYALVIMDYFRNYTKVKGFVNMPNTGEIF